MQAKKFIMTLVAFLVGNHFSKNVKFCLSQKFHINSTCLYNSNIWYILLFLEVRKNER